MKKLVALILTVALLLSVMSFAAAEEPFEITVMVPEFTYDVDYVEDGNPVLAAFSHPDGSVSGIPSAGSPGGHRSWSGSARAARSKYGRAGNLPG